MSIWSPFAEIGFPWIFRESKRPRGGTVRGYAEGWSNHFPTADVEGPGCIMLASVPVWCVPGHYDEEDWERVGEWLRVHVHATGHDYWTKEDYVADATVVLNVAAARALRDELDRWISQPKARARRSAA